MVGILIAVRHVLTASPAYDIAATLTRPMADKSRQNAPPTPRKAAKSAAPPVPATHTIETARGSARVLGGQVQITRWKPVLSLAFASLVATALIFPPVDFWPIGYICLVPWLVAVCASTRARSVYVSSYFLGLLYFLIHVRWMIPVTLPGYISMCLYFAAFFPLAAWPIRHMYRRRGISVAIVAPFVWTACEYLRSLGPLSFPWVLLGHSQYRVLTIIQISDLFGAYGVSFVLAMVNGWFTDLIVQPILIWRDEKPHAATRLPFGSLTTAMVVAGAIIYGMSQTSSVNFTPGPRVAVVQGDFVMYVDARQSGRTPATMIFQTYLDMAARAAMEKPDLIVLPETAWSFNLNDEFINATASDLDQIRKRRYGDRWTLADLEQVRRSCKQTRDALQAIVNEEKVSIVVGSISQQWRATGIPERVDAYNSAFLLTPGRTSPQSRYDKRHLVLFGEYVPFRYSFHSIYEMLNKFTPFGSDGTEYSLTAGDSFNAFEIDAPSRGARFRAGTPICFEEVMPYVARAFVTADGADTSRKNIDILLTISNDGWFYHTAELEQHLAASVFRAVENRIAVARSVNTGTSALIDPNGRISARVKLDQAKIAALDGVRTALKASRAQVERFTERIRGSSMPNKDAAAEYAAVSKAINSDTPAALKTVGPEFEYVGQRLSRLVYELSDPNATQALAGANNLIEQIEEDLDSVDRWQRRPDTAPGYVSGDLNCDTRLTLYSRWGDWFAQGAGILTLLMLLDWLRHRFKKAPSVQPA